MNYRYDKIGNLKKDIAEGIDTIRWTVYGKINKIVKSAANTNISYDYDAAGNRTVKEVAAHDTLTKTFYVRDASGNVMAVYKKEAGNLKWEEQHLYGSSRLGMLRIDSLIPANPPNAGETGVYDELLYGTRNYELTNHLGNVLATISDKKIGHPINDTTVDYFNADVVSANDYYPGGMQQPGRTYQAGSGSYRYGFNGKENDKEANIGFQDYGFREYDKRLVRFISVDPLKKKYPYYSPYQFAGNNTIKFIDLDGLEPANNPNSPGMNEVKSMAEANAINASTMIANTVANISSPGFWSTKDNEIKGTYSCGPNGNYVTDTKGDPKNKFNMFVYNGATLNVNESQAKDFNNYETFVVNQLMTNFVTGKGAENYSFPTNGIISSKFLKSDILKSALADFMAGKPVENKQYSFGPKELGKDFSRNGTFSSITGFVGSGTITIKKTDDNMVRVTIFNVTSLTSGDLLKDPSGNIESTWPKSYARDPNTTTTFGNISQTFNLSIPASSPILAPKK